MIDQALHVRSSLSLFPHAYVYTLSVLLLPKKSRTEQGQVEARRAPLADDVGGHGVAVEGEGPEDARLEGVVVVLGWRSFFGVGGWVKGLNTIFWGASLEGVVIWLVVDGWTVCFFEGRGS